MVQFLSCFTRDWPFNTWPAQGFCGQNTSNSLENQTFSELYLAAKTGERFPSRIACFLLTGAGVCIAVLATARAKSLAVRLAQCSGRQGQKHLFTQHIFKQQTVLLIIPDFCFFCSYRSLRTA